MFFAGSNLQAPEESKYPHLNCGQFVDELDTYTIELRVKFTKDDLEGGGQYILREWLVSMSTDFYEYRSGIGMHLYGVLGGSGQGSGVYYTNTWYHMAVVVYRSMNKARFFYQSPDDEMFYEEFELECYSPEGYPQVAELILGGGEAGAGLDLDEVRVWKVERTSGQLKDFRDKQIPTEDYPNLLAYYDFEDLEEGSTNVKDQSGNGNDATLVNFDLTKLSESIGKGVPTYQNFLQTYTGADLLEIHSYSSHSDGFDEVFTVGLSSDYGENPVGITDEMFNNGFGSLLHFEKHFLKKSGSSEICAFVTNINETPQVLSFSEDHTLTLRPFTQKSDLAATEKFMLSPVSSDLSYVSISPLSNADIQLVRRQGYDGQLTFLPKEEVQTPPDNFEGVRDGDTDIYNNDGIRMRNYLTYTPINSGNFSSESERVYSFTELRKKMSVNISVDDLLIPKTPISLSASLGHSFETISSRREESIYTYERENHEVYRLTVDEDKLSLAMEFINAIQNDLETPSLSATYTVNSLSRLKKTGLWDNYIRFLDKWGTHYAKKVTYGAFGIRIKRSTLTETNLTENSETEFKGNIGIKNLGGVGGGVKVERGSTTQNGREDSKEEYFYMGGQAAGDGSLSVDPSNSQPIKIQLSEISNLLVLDLMKGMVMDENVLDKKRDLLKLIISEYLKMPIPGNRIPRKKRHYKIKIEEVIIDQCDSDEYSSSTCEIYGSIYSMMRAGRVGIGRYNFLLKKKRDDAFSENCGEASNEADDITDHLSKREHTAILNVNQYPIFSIVVDLKEKDTFKVEDDKWGKSTVQWRIPRELGSHSHTLTFEKKNSRMNYPLKMTIKVTAEVEDLNTIVAETVQIEESK